MFVLHEEVSKRICQWVGLSNDFVFYNKGSFAIMDEHFYLEFVYKYNKNIKLMFTIFEPNKKEMKIKLHFYHILKDREQHNFIKLKKEFNELYFLKNRINNFQNTKIKKFKSSHDKKTNVIYLDIEYENNNHDNYSLDFVKVLYKSFLVEKHKNSEISETILDMLVAYFIKSEDFPNGKNLMHYRNPYLVLSTNMKPVIDFDFTDLFSNYNDINMNELNEYITLNYKV